MKKKLLTSWVIALWLCFLPIALLSQHITFDYDGAGNRTSRVITLSSAKKKAKRSKDIEPETFNDFIGKRTITFYPNPVKEKLIVDITELDVNHAALLNLYDLQGNCITTTKSEQPRTTLNMSRLPTGTYILHICIDEETTTWKIIKE